MIHVTFLAALALLFAVAFGRSHWQYNFDSGNIPTSSSITFRKIYEMKDVEVLVDLDRNASIGDLEISVTHQPSGKSVKLLHQQCGSVSAPREGWKLNFFDTADSNSNCVNKGLGTFDMAPYEPLSLFNGLSGDVHTFTLSVKDVIGAATGQLEDWRLTLYVDQKYLALPYFETMTWDRARQRCEDSFNTNLAVIESSGDISHSKSICEEECGRSLGSPFPGVSLNFCQGCWLGLSDRATEGTFEWVDGTALTSNSPTNWGSVEPSNSNGNEDCVQMRIDEYRWNDRPCSDAGDIPLCANPSWRNFVAIASEETWENARTKCGDDLGKDLAVFEDIPDDRAQIEEGKKICREACEQHSWCLGCWIGLHDRAHENNFEWIIDSRLTIDATSATDWNSGEPNNYGGNEDCAVIYKEANYKWNDVGCDSSGYIPLCHTNSRS